jgi:hypothetical protein
MMAGQKGKKMTPMYIRIIDTNNKTERRVYAETVDFDSVNWYITINGKISVFKRADFCVLIFA